MTTCIHGSQLFDEGAIICVNGRGLRCVSGEWRETGQPCDANTATPGSQIQSAPAIAPSKPSPGPKPEDVG